MTAGWYAISMRKDVDGEGVNTIAMIDAIADDSGLAIDDGIGVSR